MFRRILSTASTVAKAARRQRDAGRIPSFHKSFKPKSDLPRQVAGFLGTSAIFGGVVYYRQTHIESAPFTGRERVMWLPDSAQRLIESLAADGVLEDHQETLLPENHPTTLVVKEIAHKLIAASGELGANYDWKIYVVDEPVVNAFCLPGGTIVVFTGLFGICETKAELAMVLAHEIGHNLAKHGCEIVGDKWMHMAGMLLLQMSVGFQIYTLGSWTTNKLRELLYDLPLSQTLEREADYIGLMLMAKACYDPHVAPGVLESLGSGVTEETKYFSTHPPDAERAQNVRDWMPLAEKIQGENCAAVSKLFGWVARRAPHGSDPLVSRRH